MSHQAIALSNRRNRRSCHVGLHRLARTCLDSELSCSGIQHLLNVAAISTYDSFLGEDGVKLRGEILIGRPLGRFGLPVAFYNRHMATLEHKLKRADKLPDERDSGVKEYLGTDVEMWAVVGRFLQGQHEDYNSAKSRYNAAQPYFGEIFGFQPFSRDMPGTIYSTKVDNGKEIPRVIIEIKSSTNDPGELVLRGVHRYAQCILELKVRVQCSKVSLC